MYLIFDTETTGLPKNFEAPHTDLDNWPRLVQLAWQLHDAKGKLLSSNNLIVKPVGFTIPFNAEKVHGISTEIALEHGHDLREVLDTFAKDIKKADLLIGHNIEFDLKIVGAELVRTDLDTQLWDKKNYDTKSEETAAFVQIPGGRGGGFKWPTLTELYQKLFNEGFDDAHDAAYDVAATARAFFGLITQKIAVPFDKTALEEITYEPPVLDEANFSRKRRKAGMQIPAQFRGTIDEPIPFAHLHTHTQFSILQSTSSVGGLVAKAKENNMKALAITDLGNMHAAFNAVNYGDEAGIKIIMGCTLYVAEERLKKQFTKNNPDRKFMQVLLAKDQEAYHRLAKLCSLGYIEGYYAGYPRVDKDLIREYSEGMIALTGSSTRGFMGEIPALILNVGEHAAEEAFKWWLDIFGEDFYVEIQRHGLEEEDRVNEVLLNLAAKYNVRPVATQASLYNNREDSDAHDSLLCVKDGEKKSVPIGRGRGTRFGMPNDEYYFKTQEEMNELFSDIPVALENTQEIVDKCAPIKLKRPILMPKFEMPPEFETQDDYLRYLTYEGAKKHYGEITDEIRERLDHELKIIKGMGFPGYFLIVQDFINAARNQGVFVGPGRGSAAGSAVAYCVGITNIDPIKYDLLFERFLNPERVSMPDIDIDFDDEGRQSAIDYVVNKYGKNQVAQIITYGTMAAKMSIKDVARVLDLPLDESNKLAKLVPEKPGTKLKNAYVDVAELKQILELDENKDLRPKVLKQAKILEGSIRGTGIHAAGVIIAPDDLLEHIPVCVSKDADLLVTQFDGKVIEEAGMLKMDFLGLKTLTIIKDALALIKKNHDIEIDIDKIPLDDEKTFQLYQNGDTIGTFQFESEGMQMYLKQLKPTNIEDLIAMNSLYRPGPMDFIPNYIRRKNGQEKVEYPHPMLEVILKNTFGIMVYQEQIMQTAQLMAGYTLGGADLLRRAMGKKKVSEMEYQEGIFIKGAKEKYDIPEEKAREVFDIMKKFAEYGFNRSHSAAYSVVAYQTAYLKANYTPEYMAAVLTHNMNNIEKITFFIDECQKLGVKVLGPDINESSADFSVNDQGQIRFGLAAVKGTGDAAIDSIIEEREKNGIFKDIYDFARRINPRTVNKKSFESLAYAGAFDGFGIDRAQYFYSPNDKSPSFTERLIKYANAYKKDKETASVSLFGADSALEIAKPEPPNCEPWTRLEKLNHEKDVVGFYVSGHPLEQFRTALKTLKIQTMDNLEPFDRQEINIAGVVSGKSVRASKNGNMFTRFMLEDFKSSLEIVLFGNDHEEFTDQIEENQLLMITGKVQRSFRNEGQFEFRVTKIQNLEEMKEMHCKGVEVKVDIRLLNEEFIANIEHLVHQYAGEHQLKVKLLDFEEELYVDLVSKKYKIQISDGLVNKLEDLGMECKMIY
ncbi:MAG: DNA polymerase III subunit alpha [Microscillaceae bacterium]|nr:DNA polymerase III subunit alpha [Microscillaceae bacterium]